MRYALPDNKLLPERVGDARLRGGSRAEIFFNPAGWDSNTHRAGETPGKIGVQG